MLKYHIQTIELSAAAKSITFSAIPSTFDDLVLVYSGRSDRAGNIDDPINISFNASTSGYSSRSLVGSGSTTYSEGYGTNVVFGGYMPAASTTANTFCIGSATILNYRSSLPKSITIDFVSENNATTAYQHIAASLWTNAAPVTSITVSAQVSNLVQFSSASLYGIKRGSDGRTEAASGGTITTSGGFTIHTFTGSGTFVANRNLNLEYLVVAGGGAGGSNIGGGGGAGGYRTVADFSAAAGTSYIVTVGAGGAGQGEQLRGLSGTNSAFGAIVSTGGGGGAGNNASSATALSGGSGGGGSYNNTTGASGNAGGFSPVEGFAGGNGMNPTFGAGGGGGSSSAGVDGSATANQGSQGGAGAASFITGTSVTRAGGGGGGRTQGGTVSPAVGGTGGGGSGGFGTSPNSQTDPTAGSTNTGSGGGGAGWGSAELGAAGGSGIVIIRYMTPA